LELLSSTTGGRKSVKAFLYNAGYTSIMTHSLKQLVLEAIKINNDFTKILADAKFLDMYYIPTRHPNGLSGDLTPAEYFEEEDANKCINSSISILNHVKKFIHD